MIKVIWVSLEKWKFLGFNLFFIEVGLLLFISIDKEIEMLLDIGVGESENKGI